MKTEKKKGKSGGKEPPLSAVGKSILASPRLVPPVREAKWAVPLTLTLSSFVSLLVKSYFSPAPVGLYYPLCGEDK